MSDMPNDAPNATPSKDAMQPHVITDHVINDQGGSRPVTDQVNDLVEEGRAAGIEPVDAPAQSTPTHPRSHLPKYAGRMRGVLPDDHPAVKRKIKELRAQRARERERDAAAAAVEAAVPQKIDLGTRVVIGDNAKVDYEDENGTRVKGHYGGVEGEVYQTYVDHEGVRRHIIVSRDPETGKSHYAPVAVRECDLRPIGRREGGGRRFHTVPQSPEQRAERQAAEAQRRASMTPEEIERATFGGLTAEELANKMCGL